jgi:hypothetical protein
MPTPLIIFDLITIIMSPISLLTLFTNSKLLILPEVNVVVNVELIKPNLVMNVDCHLRNTVCCKII